MINNVVFDIGRVLIHYNWMNWLTELIKSDEYDYFMKGYAKKNGVKPFWSKEDPEELVKKLFEGIFANGEWDEIDRGVLPLDSVIVRMASHMDGGHYEELVRFCLDHTGSAFSQYEYARPWIWNIKAKGYGVFYLSNYSRYIMAQNMECMDFVPMMNGGVFSDDVKLIKPDPAIYELLCERYCLIPSECVFIDDKKENVDAAIKLGFHGIQMKNYDQASVELNNLLEKN